MGDSTARLSSRRSAEIARQAEAAIGQGQVQATLAANPFAIAAFVIVAVEGEPIAEEAEWIAQGVIAPFETRQRVSILFVMAHVNRTQRMQVVMDEAQDVIIALTRIADHLASGGAAAAWSVLGFFLLTQSATLRMPLHISLVRIDCSM